MVPRHFFLFLLSGSNRDGIEPYKATTAPAIRRAIDKTPLLATICPAPPVGTVAAVALDTEAAALLDSALARTTTVETTIVWLEEAATAAPELAATSGEACEPALVPTGWTGAGAALEAAAGESFALGISTRPLKYCVREAYLAVLVTTTTLGEFCEAGAAAEDLESA